MARNLFIKGALIRGFPLFSNPWKQDSVTRVSRLRAWNCQNISWLVTPFGACVCFLVPQVVGNSGTLTGSSSIPPSLFPSSCASAIQPRGELGQYRRRGVRNHAHLCHSCPICLQSLLQENCLVYSVCNYVCIYTCMTTTQDLQCICKHSSFIICALCK